MKKLSISQYIKAAIGTMLFLALLSAGWSYLSLQSINQLDDERLRLVQLES